MKKFLDLIDVKSIVTLMITGVFSFLAITKVLSGEQFMMIFAMIITYFFAKKDTPKT